MPLFGNMKKSPQEISKILKECFQTLSSNESAGKKSEKVLEEIGKQLVNSKYILQGHGDQDPQQEQVAQLAQDFYDINFFGSAINHLGKLNFENRKDVVIIFSHLLRRQIGSRSPTVEYIVNKKEILGSLVLGYKDPEVALSTGMILRECIRYEPLCKHVIDAPSFYNFFTYIEYDTFDIASDAFTTFKELLTKHKALASAMLVENYDKFFCSLQEIARFRKLCNSATIFEAPRRVITR